LVLPSKYKNFIFFLVLQEVFLFNGPFAMLGIFLPLLALLGSGIEVSVDEAALLRREASDGSSKSTAAAVDAVDDAAKGITGKFGFYRFKVLKTKGGGVYSAFSEFSLNNDSCAICSKTFLMQKPFQESNFSLASIDLVDEKGDSMNTWYEPTTLLDGSKFGAKLHIDQSVKFKVKPGTEVKSYGLKTSLAAPESDPVSWTFEGSMDGVSWELLSRKDNYNTPDRNQMMGPFVLSYMHLYSNDRQTKMLDMSRVGPRPFYIPPNEIIPVPATEKLDDVSGTPEGPFNDIDFKPGEPASQVIASKEYVIPSHGGPVGS